MFVIAGASGRTGRVVAETLLSQGRQVRLVTRDAARVEAFKSRGAEVAGASLDDERAREPVRPAHPAYGDPAPGVSGRQRSRAGRARAGARRSRGRAS